MSAVVRAVSLALVLVCTAAAADSFGPRRPSEIVTLVPTDTCDDGERFLYTTVTGRDGSLSPLVIPPKRVSVLTRWSFAFTGGNPGEGSVAELRREGSVAPTAMEHVVFDASGVGAGTADVQAVLGPGEVACGRQTSGFAPIAPFSGVLHGFFAKDE